jgi:glycogen debranching enzyme
MHQDGRLAEGPIALCEVQAYVYAAKRGAAALAGLLGRDGDAARLAEQAEALRRRFEAVFWDEELAMYVLALDGDKRPCRVRSSNAGHCLFTGIAAPDRARRVAAALLAEDMFSGWGVRTLAGAETLYNPMSYHNGSVWPHDNSLIGLGMAMHGLSAMAGQILGGMLDASQFFDLHRLPELFCGFKRRPGEGPTSYPVACAPQTWASGAPLLLLQACTGLRIDAARQEIAFSHPMLPAFLDHVRIDGLRVGKAEVDLLIKRHGDDAGVYVTRRKGEVGIVTKK